MQRKKNLLRVPFLLLILSLNLPSESFQAAEWDKTLTAAESEGEVVIYSTSSFDQVFSRSFQQKYSQIKVKLTIGRGSDLAQRILSERRSGKYLPDVFVQAATTPTTILYPAKVFAPIKPLLVHPEVADQSKWWKGKHHYLDPEEQYVFMFEGTPTSGTVSYNTKLVDPSLVKSYWEFLDPKWRGKIVARDPSDRGPVSHVLRFLYHNPELGPKFLRRFFSETEITISRNDEQIMDWLGLGRFAIAFFTRGIDPAMKQGLPVSSFPDYHFNEGAYIYASTGTVSFFNHAPNPNAAKIAINWLLSREGQSAWLKTIYRTEGAIRDSMREDIPKDLSSSGYRQNGVKYAYIDGSKGFDMAPIYKLVKEALGGTSRK